MNKSDSYKEKNIDAIAEQWVNLVLAHARAKKLIEETAGVCYKQQMSSRIKKGITLARINKNNHG